MSNTVAGSPTSFSRLVVRKPQKIDCPKTREIAVRNTGCNTLWISLDGKTPFDVASGTSWDIRAEVDHFFIRTKVGTTTMVAVVTT